jgi:hypothetical protein
LKNIKTVFTLIAFIAFTGLTAQTVNKQVTKEVLQKKYSVNNGDVSITYAVKVNSKVKSSVNVKASDYNKKEQDRVKDNLKITKLIHIDSDSDSNYDNVLELTYESRKDDNFKILETSNGFIIEVTGKKLDYNFLKKDYVITSKDKDTFEVVVLKSY